MDDRTFDLELVRLRRQFAEGLVTRLERMEVAWQRLEEGDMGAWEPFYREVHNLAGACESYGLYRLGPAARHLEQMTRPLWGSDCANERCPELAHAVDRVRKLAAEVLAGITHPVG